MWMRVKPTMEETVAQEILAHYQSYYRLSYSYLKNKEDAMDAVQESAYKAMVKCGHCPVNAQQSCKVHTVETFFFLM